MQNLVIITRSDRQHFDCTIHWNFFEMIVLRYIISQIRTIH